MATKEVPWEILVSVCVYPNCYLLLHPLEASLEPWPEQSDFG